MWQVLLALLLVSASTGSTRGRAGAPSISFAALQRKRSLFPWYFGISVLIHAVCVFTLVFTVELIRNSEREFQLSKIRTYSGVPIAIRIPERSYYPTRQVAGAARRARSHAGAVLIQPARRTSPSPAPLLPSFMYWVAASIPPPESPITPGSSRPAPGTVLRPAEPGLQAPNQEAAAASVSLARMDAKANVSVPPSSSMPVRMDAPPERTGAGSSEGVPLAAVSISQFLPENGALVAIPPVTVPGGDGPGFDGSGGNGDARSRDAAAFGRSGTGPAANSSEEGAGHPGAGEPVVRMVETRVGRVELREFPDGSQERRYPRNGFFDAVLVQASAGDLVREAAELLTGRPVQTVYIAVGAGRDWILQYCVPRDAETGAGQSGMIVSLAGPSKLEPPWIQTAALPPGGRGPSGKSTVFYGILGADGRLRDMRALRGTQYQARAELLAYLDKWEFRPARRDSVPADVEVLLIVPPDAAL
jgi:hypothetical protein